MKNKNAQALGKLGGEATKRKHGKKHYQKLAGNMNRKKAESVKHKRGAICQKQ